MCKQIIASMLEEQIRSIIKPLEEYGITYFSLDKNVKNTLCIRLSSNDRWINTYCERKFYEIGAFELDYRSYKTGFMLWSEIKTNPIYWAARNEFDIANGITIIKRLPVGCEFYHFGGQPENNNLANFLLAHIGLLEHFIAYFKQQFSTVLVNIIRDQLPLLKNSVSSQQKNVTTANPFDALTKQYYVPRGAGIYITPRQKQIVDYLKLGKTADEIALILKMAPKTCENYLKELKIKFDASSIAHLGYKLGEFELNL